MTAETLFYLAFGIQIIALSVVHPLRLGRTILEAVKTYPYAQYDRVYPCEPDALRKWVQGYWSLNVLIGVAGVYLLSRLHGIMQVPGWSDGEVETLVTGYFFFQILPFLVFSTFVHRFNRELRRTADVGRVSASLERRKLADYVAPGVLYLAVALYPTYLAFLFYTESHGFPGFAGIRVNLLAITLLYAWTFGASYLKVSGKKSNPYQSDSDRRLSIEMTVKICIYTCVAGVVFLMLNMSLAMADRQDLEPLAMCLFYVLCATFYIRGVPMWNPLDVEGYETPQPAPDIQTNAS